MLYSFIFIKFSTGIHLVLVYLDEDQNSYYFRLEKSDAELMATGPASANILYTYPFALLTDSVKFVIDTICNSEYG